MVSDEDALLDLLRELRSRHYHFTCVTPATHARVLSKPIDGEPTLRDIFGWNRSFQPEELAPELLRALEKSGCVEHCGDALKSAIRVASAAGHLFLHSSYPTHSAEAVFFGPDTYRFLRFISGRVDRLATATHIVDMGAGSGAGGIVLGMLLPDARVTLVDINPAATELARINAKLAGVSVETADEMPRACDLVIANPPYMMDAAHRTYRDGGALLGGEVALQWVDRALQALTPGGTILLYTGAALVSGEAPLLSAIEASCVRSGACLEIDEIDPDVFGEELDKPGYEKVERIAAFGVQISVRQRAKPAQAPPARHIRRDRS